MDICILTYVYIYVYICIYLYVYMYMHTYIYICIYLYVYMYMHTCIYIYVHKYIYIYIYMHDCACVYIIIMLYLLYYIIVCQNNLSHRFPISLARKNAGNGCRALRCRPTFGDSKDMKNEFGGPTSQVRGSMLVLCFSWLNDENQP